jgi:hypothetical protein
MRHNTDWYVHPDYPNLLLVISTSRTPSDSQFFIPYGGDFFCHERFALPILCAAIRCYDIPIHDSPTWRSLPQYRDLCNHYPPQSSHTVTAHMHRHAPATTTPHTSTRPPRHTVPQTPEVSQFLTKLTSPEYPPDIHLKPDVAVALASTSRRALIDTIIHTLSKTK